MLDDTNLFSKKFYRKFHTVSNDITKFSNFLLSYPGKTDCVWVIISEKIMEMEFKIQVLAFDLSCLSETVMN